MASISHLYEKFSPLHGGSVIVHVLFDFLQIIFPGSVGQSPGKTGQAATAVGGEAGASTASAVPPPATAVTSGTGNGAPTSLTKDVTDDRKAVPGTTLKCLEDPSATAAVPPVVPAPAPAPAPKKPSYRVLEDPSMITSVVMPVKPVAKRPTYKVLEDPMLASMYEPSTSSKTQDTGARVSK